MIFITVKKNEKSDEEFSLIGRNGATVKFDTDRTLKLTLGSMDRIEQKFRTEQRIASVGGLLLGNWIPTDRLKFILLEMLNGGRAKDTPEIKEEDLEGIYEGYIENTGNREDLVALMNEVHLAATKNPIKFRQERIQAKKEAEAAEKLKQNPGGDKPPTSDMKSLA